MTVPYTYYLFHQPTNTHYYGVRWCKNCNPTDLWQSYFSSSRKVKKLIEEYGAESFHFEIRKTFSNKDQAILWEEKVLRRLQVHKKPQWLNVIVSKAIRYDTHPRLGSTLSSETKKKISIANRGKKRTDEDRKRMSEQRKGSNHWNYGNKWSEETKRKNSESNKAWRLANPDKITMPPNAKGRKHSEETKKRMADSRKRYWELRRLSYS